MLHYIYIIILILYYTVYYDLLLFRLAEPSPAASGRDERAVHYAQVWKSTDGCTTTISCRALKARKQWTTDSFQTVEVWRSHWFAARRSFSTDSLKGLSIARIVLRSCGITSCEPQAKPCSLARFALPSAFSDYGARNRLRYSGSPVQRMTLNELLRCS